MSKSDDIGRSLISQNNSIPLESLSKKTLCEIVASNLLQMAQLNEELTVLRDKNTSLEKDKECYRMIIEENKKLINEHEINIEKLLKENEELKQKISVLEEHVKQQDNIIADMKNDIGKLNQAITELKSRDEPITVREGITALEQQMMVEITGSKKKTRPFYGILDLAKDKHYKINYNNYLQKYNITQDHIDLLVSLKKEGNKAAHCDRPVLMRNEWDGLVTSMLDDPTDVDDVKMVKELLVVADTYNKVMPNGEWMINKP